MDIPAGTRSDRRKALEERYWRSPEGRLETQVRVSAAIERLANSASFVEFYFPPLDRKATPE